MKRAVVFGSLLLVFSTGLYAQSPLLGKYTGSFTAPDNRGRDKPWGVTIEITSAEDGKLKGGIETLGTTCGGAVPAEGTYVGNKIKLSATQVRTQGCNPQFDAVAEGNKLVGKMPFLGVQRDLTVSK